MRALLLTLALTAGCSSSDEEAAKGSGDSAPDSADTAVSPYDPDPPVTLGPTDRPVEVILPENYDVSRTYPVVVMLHGYGASVVVATAAARRAGARSLSRPSGRPSCR